MAKSSVTNECDVCQKTIAAYPEHFDGHKVTDAGIVRCVLYEMFTLALAVQTLRHGQWEAPFHYALFDEADSEYKKGLFSPEEVAKTAALIKVRILYDFLYASHSDDDFQATAVIAVGNKRTPSDFSGYGITPAAFKNQATIKQLEDGLILTRRSINKFVAHLVEERMLKPHCIPRPIFSRGKETTIKVARLILEDAEAFVRAVTNPPNDLKLDNWGRGYWKAYQEAIARIDAA